MFIYCKVWMSQSRICTVTSFVKCNSAANIAYTKLELMSLEKQFEKNLQNLKVWIISWIRTTFFVFRNPVTWTSIITRKLQTFLKPFGIAFKLAQITSQKLIILLYSRALSIYEVFRYEKYRGLLWRALLLCSKVVLQLELLF